MAVAVERNVQAERLTFSLKDVIMFALFFAGLAATYFGSQASAVSQMEQVATKIASQKLETVNARLADLKENQEKMDLKLDRMMEAVIQRNNRPTGSGR